MNNIIDNRDKFIGGSDLPIIMGINRTITPFQFAKEKLNIIPKEDSDNIYTHYGHVMEEKIRNYINDKFKTNYKPSTFTTWYLRGNADGLDDTAKIPLIEIKTYGKELNIDYYKFQCQFYMGLFGHDKLLLVGYKRPDIFYTGIDYNLEKENKYFNFTFNEKNIVEHVIKRDEKLIKQIIEKCNNFYNALNALRKDNNLTEEKFNDIFYGPTVTTMVKRFKKLEKQLLDFKKIEDDYNLTKEKLYELFEFKNILSFENKDIKITRVNPSQYEKRSINTKLLEKEQPDIYNKYISTKTINKKGYLLIAKKEE